MAGRSVSGRDGKCRPTLRVGAAAVVAGSGLLVPAGTPGYVEVVHRAITLVDSADPAAATAPTFADGMYGLLNMLGIGDKTLPQLAGGTETVGELLGASGLSVSTQLGNPALLQMLGLDKYTLGDILTDFGLNPSNLTVDEVLQKVGLANVTLDDILTPLGIPSTETTMGLADRFSVAHLTLDQLLARGGFSGSETLNQVLTQENLNGTALPTLMGALGLVSMASCNGGSGGSLNGSSTIDQFINCLALDGVSAAKDAKGHPLPYIPVTGSMTVQQILESQHFYNAMSSHTNVVIGNWTIGQILNFTSSTTIQQFVDNLHVNLGVTSDPSGGTPSTPTGGDTEQSPSNDGGSIAVPSGSTVSSLPTLGGESFGAVLNWINLNPADTLADIIANEVKIGTQPLANLTIQGALDGLLVDPLAIGPSPSQVQDSTTLADLLTGMGFGTETLDQLLNLSAP